MNKLSSPIRLALYAEKETLNIIEQVFYSHPQFEIIISTNDGDHFLKQLDAANQFPDIVFISGGLAITDKQHTLFRLFHEYPGLRLIGIIRKGDKLKVLQHLLQYGCGHFILESDLEELENSVPDINFSRYAEGFFRTHVFDRESHIIVRIHSYHSHLLTLLT
jgi:hypothetical protein